MSPLLPGKKPPDPTSSTSSEEGPNLDGYEDEPVLVAGDGGVHVAELARLLAAAGHETPISRGEEGPILTTHVYEAVRAFRDSNGVEDELASERVHVVGPETWAALKRAAA